MCDNSFTRQTRRSLRFIGGCLLINIKTPFDISLCHDHPVIVIKFHGNSHFYFLVHSPIMLGPECFAEWQEIRYIFYECTGKYIKYLHTQNLRVSQFNSSSLSEMDVSSFQKLFTTDARSFAHVEFATKRFFQNKLFLRCKYR